MAFTHTHHRRNSSLSQRKPMQAKFAAALPRVPPSPLLPTVQATPVPTPLPSPKHEKSAWFSSPSTSPRSSLSSVTHPIRLDDYKFARHTTAPAPVGIVSFGLRQLMQRRGRWALLLLLLVAAFFTLCAPAGRSVLRRADSWRAPVRDPIVPAPGSAPRRPHRGGSWRRPTHAALALNAAQELAVVTAYLAALPENHIPDVDPAAPLDPQLVLDFDTRGAAARDELDELVHDVWHRNPVVLFGKMVFADSREVRTMVEKLNLAPGPTVFDVDTRPDAGVLEPLLYRLTNATSLPVLLVGGTPIGGLAEVRAMDAEGTLARLVEIAGAKVNGKKKKGGRKH